MKKNIVIIVLSIVILSLTSYIVYDKINEKEYKKEEIKDDSNKEEIKNELVEKVYEEKDFVYDANYTYESKYDLNNYEEYLGDIYFNDIISGKGGINVPYINIKSEDANKINEELKLLYNEYMKRVESSYANKEAGNIYGSYRLDYKIYKSNNILSIIVVCGEAFTDVPHPDYYGYIFDLETGMQIKTMEEFANLKNLSSDELKQLSIKKIKEFISNEDKKDERDGYKENENETLSGFNNDFNILGTAGVEDPGVVYFIDENNKINLLYNVYKNVGLGKFTELLIID